MLGPEEIVTSYLYGSKYMAAFNSQYEMNPIEIYADALTFLELIVKSGSFHSAVVK